MEITLTPAEYAHAAYVGFCRRVACVTKLATANYNYSGAGYDIDVLGSIGEYVVAKALGVFWAGPGHWRSVDVGGNLEVRSSLRPNARLIVHDEDRDDLPYVLVVGQYPTLRIAGYILGKHAKRRDYWTDPAGGRPAYFVPQEDLSPIHYLKKNSKKDLMPELTEPIIG